MYREGVTVIKKIKRFIILLQQPDLTGLTIIPSDPASVTPFGSKHVIATATGGFTGTPKVEGFEGKVWKTLRKDNELWLTTQSGTVMILR